METIQEKQQVILPVRIVKTVGNIARAENLLIPKPLALLATFKESDTARLTKDGEENPYILLDFGKELQGGVRLVTPRTSIKNLQLRIVFGESVSEALSTVGASTATNDHSPRDITVNVANLSVLDFGKTGFRFAKIELLTENTSIWFKNIVAISKTADIEKKGFIKTSDGQLNEILDVAEYTAYVCLQDGVIWDGIKRDRLVWAGDLNTEILTLTYLYGALPHVKNCLRLLRDETPDDCWMNNIPSYSVWWILNLVDYCWLSGDTEYFKANIDYVDFVLRELDACIDENGVDFLRTGKRTPLAYFLDWPSAGKPDAFGGTMALIYYTMKALGKFGDMPYDKEAAARILQRMEKYQNIPVEMKQTVAMQVVCGGGPADAKEFLEKDGAKGFSTFMAYFLLKGLALCGSDKAIELAKEFYGGMLSRGATTFWEDFSLDWLEGSGRIDEETPAGLKDLHADYGAFCYIGLRHSFCHGWASGVVGYFVEEVLGVKALAAGYEQVAVRPNLNGLEWVEGSIPTPYGNIEIFARAGEAPRIKVPEGITLVK